jgi:nucleoside-diphosphate-sugar epimerase
MRVLVTGATGFVGRHLCKYLQERGHQVRAAVRDAGSVNLIPEILDRVEIPDYRSMGSEDDWSSALDGVDAVIHLAGLAHVMGADRSRAIESYRQVNESATRILVRAAAREGVSRFIFVSTAKVFGEETSAKPFSEADTPAPHDEYARSKWAAELSVIAETSSSSCTAVIVRPPMVYGPDVRGNFPRLVRLIKSGIPLPFGAIANCRTIVSVWNLCDLLECALMRPLSSGQVLLPMDNRAVSTP